MMRNRLGSRFKNWFHRLSRNRNLKRISRLMDLSDMKLGRKTRKYFLRLRRSLHSRRQLLYTSENLNDFIDFLNNMDFLLTSLGELFIVLIIACLFINMPSTIKCIVPACSPIILVLIGVFTKFFTIAPSECNWPVRYKSFFTHTGSVGKIMSRLWKNKDKTFIKSNDNKQYYFGSYINNYFEGFNQMAPILNMNMDYLDKPEYWSDEDYGRFMRIVLSYAFIYESADNHPDKDVLSDFINSNEVQSTAREVLDDVHERKNRICGTGTNKDTNTEEYSSAIMDEPDYDTIRSKDIQSRVTGKADEVRNILNENRMESGLG